MSLNELIRNHNILVLNYMNEVIERILINTSSFPKNQLRCQSLLRKSAAHEPKLSVLKTDQSFDNVVVLHQALSLQKRARSWTIFFGTRVLQSTVPVTQGTGIIPLSSQWWHGGGGGCPPSKNFGNSTHLRSAHFDDVPALFFLVCHTNSSVSRLYHFLKKKIPTSPKALQVEGRSSTMMA